MASKVKFDQIEAASPGGDITVNSPLKDTQGASVSGVRIVQRSHTATNIYLSSGIVCQWVNDGTYPVVAAEAEIGASFLSWDANYEVFTLTEAGIYRIETNVVTGWYGSIASNRSTTKMQIERYETSTWTPLLGPVYGYFRDVSGEAEITTQMYQTAVVKGAVNDQFRVWVEKHQGSAGIETKSDGTYITITRLGDV